MSRRATMGRGTRVVVEESEHPSIAAVRSLLEIATLYPTLMESLPRSSTGSAGRVGGTPEVPLPWRESVSRMLGEIAHLAWFLGQRLILETSGSHRVSVAMLPDRPDDRLALIGREYVGHFVPEDDWAGKAFARDLENLAERAESAAYPESFRWVDVPNRADDAAKRRDPMPCAEADCVGHYRMRLGGDSRWGITIVDPKTWPPLTCNTDPKHIVTGTELARAVVWARANGTTHLAELRAWRAVA